MVQYRTRFLKFRTVLVKNRTVFAFPRTVFGRIREKLIPPPIVFADHVDNRVDVLTDAGLDNGSDRDCVESNLRWQVRAK